MCRCSTTCGCNAQNLPEGKISFEFNFLMECFQWIETKLKDIDERLQLPTEIREQHEKHSPKVTDWNFLIMIINHKKSREWKFFHVKSNTKLRCSTPYKMIGTQEIYKIKLIRLLVPGWYAQERGFQFSLRRGEVGSQMDLGWKAEGRLSWLWFTLETELRLTWGWAELG
jgi:hypothetical protein